MRSVIVAGVLLGLLSGCSNALYDVRDTDIRALTGESAQRVEAAQAHVADAEQAVSGARGEIEARQEVLAATEESTSAAGDKVGVAEDRLEATEQSLEEAMEAAEQRRDQTIEEARRRFSEEVAQARAQHGERTAGVQAEVRAASQILAYERARQRAANAALQRAEADKALRDAEVGAARVKLRLVTFVEVMQAKGINDEEVRKRQAEYRSDLDDAEREVAELLRARDAARAEEQEAAGALAAMERVSAPPPGATPEGDAPAEDPPAAETAEPAPVDVE